jgi:hypothetical protein
VYSFVGISTIKDYQPYDAAEPELKMASTIEILRCEDEIFERLQKALDHLATFCPKKKETF